MKRQARPGASRHVGLLVIFLIALAAVALRLVWIQVVKSPELAQAALQQRMREVDLPPRRGTIYDREGEPIAVSVEAKTIFASPNLIKNKESVARALANTLGGDVADYRKKLAHNSGFEYIARKVDMDRVAALKKLDIVGIGYLDDYRRLYPSGELACQVLGFVGVDDSGLAGIEQQYNTVLAGTPGVVLGERDRKGYPIPGGIQKRIEPTHGHDIVLTIDKDIQYESQIEIAKAVKKYKAKSGSVIIMNPRNGEIYAMASTPGFNPNNYGKAKQTATRNKPVSDAFEPGSTIKSLTSSAVIDKGYYEPDSKFVLPPTLRIGGRTIHESHGRGTVTWSLTEIVMHSSNIGTVRLGEKLGAQGLYDSFSAFGLTEKPGIDFPGQAKGWLPPPSKWSASSIGNIPFGQGVSVTQLQLARAVGAIANDGMLETPHFLKDVPNDTAEAKGWPARRAIAKTTARKVTVMLEKVVTDGTGTEAAVPGYTVAGKTGTAQKATPGRGYSGGKFVGSFIGYLPAEDPQVLVYVVLDEPTNGYYGGTCAAPTFRKLAQFSVEHLKIPPSSNAARNAKTDKKGAAGIDKVSASGPKD